MKITKESIVIFLFLIVIPSCFFYYINSLIRPFNEWQTLKYSTPDSATYLDVGKWLLKEISFNEAKESIAIRPFFYPLIVATLERIHPLSLAIFQFILWQSQILIVYCFSVKLTKSRYVSIIFALISAIIISSICISLHALTETLASFLIAFSILALACYIYKKKYRYIVLHLLALSLCSVTRPSIIYTYFFSSAVIIFFLKKRYIVTILIIMLTLVPIFTQCYIIKNKFNSFKISFVDILTINDYFLSRFELYKKNIERDVNRNFYIRKVRDVRRMYISNVITQEGYSGAAKKVKKDIVDNISKYHVEFFKQFLDLILENSTQASSFVNDNRILYFATLFQSKLLMTINIISALLFLLTIAAIKNKSVMIDGYTMFSLPVLFCIYFTYLSIGVTFWQGDRFLIPIYNMSIMLFVYQTVSFLTLLRNLRENSSNIQKMTIVA